MKKLMNKKGFTLVELLAVIVILAVIILVAMNAVIPAMQKSRKNSFVTEVQTFAKAAETVYTENQVMGEAGKKHLCATVGYLKKGYVEKNDANYTGIVCIELQSDNTTKTYIAITSGQYSYAGEAKHVRLETVQDGNTAKEMKLGTDGEPEISDDKVEFIAGATAVTIDESVTNLKSLTDFSGTPGTDTTEKKVS